MTFVVGLTGNIASGKSTVARLLAEHGATVIDADALARDAVAPGTSALRAIGKRWPEAIRADGTLDRDALRRIVFSDETARLDLNAIVHPQVAMLLDRELSDARARRAPIVIYDVPLLFEAGLERDVDAIVLVDAPESVRRERLMRDRRLSAADADAMIAAQMPAPDKRARSTYVVDNAGDMEELEHRVNALWAALASRATRA
jgi:dephospho-CoA kinase